MGTPAPLVTGAFMNCCMAVQLPIFFSTRSAFLKGAEEPVDLSAGISGDDAGFGAAAPSSRAAGTLESTDIVALRVEGATGGHAEWFDRHTVPKKLLMYIITRQS
jgi:hypothetical protein